MIHPVPSFPRTIRLCLILLIATLSLGQWRSSAKNLDQDINQPQTLTLGVQVESEITAGQSLTWRIFLSEGDYLRLLVDVKSKDVAVELFAPGRSRQSGDKPLFSDAAGTVLTFHQTRIFSFIAEASGNYQLEVYASNNEAASKRCKRASACLHTRTYQPPISARRLIPRAVAFSLLTQPSTMFLAAKIPQRRAFTTAKTIKITATCFRARRQ